MIGQFKLMRMTVIWPTSRKREQGKKRGTIAPLTIALVFEGRALCMSIYFVVYRFKSPRGLKLLVKMASEQERLTIVCYILNLFRPICKYLRYSKTNTTWFISRSSKNSWSLGVGCMRLLPSASRQEVVSRIQHLETSNFPTSLNIMLYLYTTTHMWISRPLS